MAPFIVSTAATTIGGKLLNFVLGIGFGFALERAGFGNAKKLAAQFYFDDQSVLKVMFTAVVTAMVLIAVTTGIGWLDFDQVSVNPTHLWPGIIGGLLLGVGFIIGGYCPGTSLVAAATLKLDGLAFLFGCLLGVFAFGLTVPWFWGFWETSGFMGRFTIPEWLGLPYGVVVLLVVIMALGMFAGAEFLEGWLRRRRGETSTPTWRPWFVKAGAIGLVGLASIIAVVSIFVPDPAVPRRRAEAERIIASRERHIEPVELLSVMRNNQVSSRLIDVRSEADFNQFHLVDAIHWTPELEKSDWAKSLPADTLKVVMSNDEAEADAVAKELMTKGIRQVYVLAGGLNTWLDTYGKGEGTKLAAAQPDKPRYVFLASLGSRYPAASPDRWTVPLPTFKPKVKFDKPMMKVSGGCGG